MSYNYTKKSQYSFLETIDELLLSFWENWFWLVSNVDVTEKVSKKVDKDFPNYKILGFCKPEIAYKYLSEDMNLWVFLPCSICVYEKDWSVYISSWLPEDIISNFIENKDLKNLDIEISILIKKIIDDIS